MQAVEARILKIIDKPERLTTSDLSIMTSSSKQRVRKQIENKSGKDKWSCKRDYRDSWLPIWRKISPVGQQISRFLLCFSFFWPLFYAYGQFYFFKTPKRQEFVTFLGLFCMIWISCKNIELSQDRKSNLFPDFFLDLGNPVSNLEG